MNMTSFQHVHNGNVGHRVERHHATVGRLTKSLTTPSTRDWENYKDIIIDLYMSQNMKISEVEKEMRQLYGFKAT
jgi:hypothetical protein